MLDISEELFIIKQIKTKKYKKKNKNFLKLYIVTSITITLIIYIILEICLNKDFRNFFYLEFKKIIDHLEKFFKNEKKKFFILFIITQYINILLILPFNFFLNLLFAFLIRNFFISFFTLMILNFVLIVTMKIIMKKKFLYFLKNKLSVFQISKFVIENYDSKNPFIYCLYIRFLILPIGFIEYFVLVMNFPFYANFVSFLIFYFPYNFNSCFLAFILNKKRNIFFNEFWKDLEIFDFFLFIVFFILNFVSIYLHYFLEKKLKNKIKNKQNFTSINKTLPIYLNIQEEEKVLLSKTFF